MASEDNKKYYWLKLYSDFFTSKRIKKLRKLAGGDTYTIIYLKMQLLALGTNGYIAYEGLENSLASELALDIDEKEDDVQVVINFLLQFKLMEQIDECTYLLPFVIECTGSETGRAIRLREARKKAKQIEQYHKYGQYQNVKLTDSQLQKLKEEFPGSWEKWIDKVDNYCQQYGKKYNDYLVTIRNWSKRDVDKQERKDIIPLYDDTNNPEFDDARFTEIMNRRGEKNE